MRVTYGVGLAMAALLAAPALPRQASTPEVMLGAALHEERVTGNLRAAVEGYRKVLAAKGAPRSLAARAQYHIGLCLEKLGDKGAREAFETVVRDYADQKEVASLAAQARARVAGMYRATAILAVLPGNPFDSRLYSLRRSVPTPAFFTEVAHEGVSNPRQKLGLQLRPGGLVAVTFTEQDPKMAVAVVNGAMREVIREVERRRGIDPSYGSVRVQAPGRWLDGEGRPRAEGLLAMEGLSWDEAQQRQTKSRITRLLAAISDAGRANQIRSSISFRALNDSWMEVTLLTQDPTLLRRLLDSIPTHEAELTGRISLLDLDFVPRHMRRDWYMFNCCKIAPVE